MSIVYLRWPPGVDITENTSEIYTFHPTSLTSMKRSPIQQMGLLYSYLPVPAFLIDPRAHSLSHFAPGRDRSVQ